MTWEMASFLILGGVLLAGFAWYERSRPPAQVVALVAALAALAIAGRIAFAAFPNVKPTTDIVVFSGYALGGAPGFAVGALAALVSNFWFGQGPWTPWQMAGWGMCGMLGAALALGTRNAGRLTLAATCGFAGLAYGALLNFSLMATYGGELSWERFWVLEVRAIPFDAAHVLGNVAFALLAGPALVRMLVRFRQRFEWGRGRVGVPAIAATLLLLAALVPAQSQAKPTRVDRAVAWLVLQQHADGGFSASEGREAGPEITAWAMLGLAAAGRNPLDVKRDGRNPVGFLRGRVDELKSPGDLARTILALEAAGVEPRDFGGRNLVADLRAKRRDNGSYEGWPGSTAFAVIALRAAGANGGLKKTLDWLRRVQQEDGGWGDTPSTPSTADGTGAVLQALSPDSKASDRGLAFLRKAQRKGGGFSIGSNGVVNAQSTAWAIQGIVAAGADPHTFRRGGASAPEYLAAHQEEDGHYRYSGASDQTPVWVTSQVLVAAAGKSFPIAAPARAPKPKDTSTTDDAADSNTSPDAPSAPSPSSDAAATPALPPASSSGSSPGGVGSPPERFAQPGETTPEAPADSSSPGLREREGSDPAETATLASQEAPTADKSSPAGAILLGLLVGALAVAAALGARRGWMRWRYGL